MVKVIITQESSSDEQFYFEFNTDLTWFQVPRKGERVFYAQKHFRVDVVQHYLDPVDGSTMTLELLCHLVKEWK